MKKKSLTRRNFLAIAGTGTVIFAAGPALMYASEKQQTQGKPATNIDDAKKTPRKTTSMPGIYPGKVIMVKNMNSVINDIPVEAAAYAMIHKSMLELTGEKSIRNAWRKLVSPGEKIGLKVNPVAGKLLYTSHAVVKSVVSQLTESGISLNDIVIWDRRDMELKDTGFTSDNYPGVTIRGTECQDEKGSFTDEQGKLYGERNIDREWFYWADVEGEYDAETMPYMVNGGKYSYFSKIVTTEVDKIINIPILKNAGGSITNAMKNLAFGSVSNTGRLHARLWNDTCAEVCAFSPLRDKVVLNITDGLRGCFNGGPGANPQFICNFNTILVSTDPVATDRIGYDIIAEKRIAEGIQKTPAPESLTFLSMASALGLGINDKSKIDLKTFEIS
jgi:uncharacterized protein (DUF362 family)